MHPLKQASKSRHYLNNFFKITIAISIREKKKKFKKRNLIFPQIVQPLCV